MDDSSIAGGADSVNNLVDITIEGLNSSKSRIAVGDFLNNSPDTFAGGLNSSDSRISVDVSGNDSTVGLTTLADGSTSTAVFSATRHLGIAQWTKPNYIRVVFLLRSTYRGDNKSAWQ